jgi:hypothetical protein
MAANAPNFTYEGASARVRIGATAIACTKVTPPKQSIKTEVLGRIGEAVKTVRTIGVLDVDGGSIEMESAVFANQFLPAVPANGFTMFEFGVHVVQRHPLVGGPMYAWWNRVRIIGTEEDAIEQSEKATKLSLPVSVIQLFYAGPDGVYKSLVQIPGLPPPTLAQFTL